jgi:dihydroorotase
MEYTVGNVLIRGGRLFRSERRAFEAADVLVQDGRVSCLGQDLMPPPGTEVFDASGRLVTPGLIDFHMHAFRYGHYLSLDADSVAHRSGTTTFVDAGSAGSLHFLAFREYVIRQSQANILAFLNVSAIGQTTDGVAGLGFHDFDDDRLIHLDSAREVIEKNRDVIVGIKVRAYTGLPSMLALERARTLADEVNLPIMVHLAPAPPTFVEVIAHLRAGDIVTHPYHGGTTTLLDANGKVLSEYWEARQRGIEVDLGLDRFHGDLSIMKTAFDQQFFPDYISTDLTSTNVNSIVFDLPTTLGKVMACGMAVEEALARCTVDPARKLGRETEIGQLCEGAPADIAVFDLHEGEVEFEDFFGNAITGTQRLEALWTFRQGVLMRPPQRHTEVLDVLNRANPWSNYDD